MVKTMNTKPIDTLLSMKFSQPVKTPLRVQQLLHVVNVPAGLTSQNMPVGMQIITTPYTDMTTFRIAHAYQGAAQPLFTGVRMPDFRNA